MSRVLLGLIAVYRRLISPLLGPHCRFAPSCAEYAAEAIRTHGALRGVAFAGWRVLRCNPFGRPGRDPVPPPSPRAERHARPAAAYDVVLLKAKSRDAA